MIALEDFDPYVCTHGMVTTSDCNNQNQLGSTGLAWTLMKLHGSGPRPIDVMAVIEACEVVHGVYRRLPSGAGGMQTADDYYGLVAGLALNHWESWVESIYRWGQAHAWCFNSEAPGVFEWRAWFGRFPGLIAHISYGADLRPSAFLRLAWACSVAWASTRPPTEQDSYVQSWLMIQTYRARPAHRNWISDCAVWFWWKRLRARGLTMKQIMGSYTQMPNHPLVRFFEDFE